MKIVINFSRTLEKGIGWGFNELGCDVIYRHSELFHLNYSQLNRKLSNVDLCFFSSGGPLPKNLSLVQLKKLFSNTRCLFWDKEADWWIDRKRYPFEYYATTRRAISRSLYLPFGGVPRLYLKPDKPNGIIMVAANKRHSPYLRGKLHRKVDADIPNRYKLVDSIPAALYGNRYEVFAKALASIGIWNNRPNKPGKIGVPIRYMDSISCGTTVITYPLPALRELFTPNKHYIETDSLASVLNTYKGREESLAKIGLCGYEYFLKHHTYKHRAQKVLDYVGLS